MLWNNLVTASEWVISIFRARGRLYVTDVSTAMEGYMVRRIKQILYSEMHYMDWNWSTAMEGCIVRRKNKYFIQKCITTMELKGGTSCVSDSESQSIALYCVVMCCSLGYWMFGCPDAVSGVRTYVLFKEALLYELLKYLQRVQQWMVWCPLPSW